MNIETMRARKKELRFTNRMISDLSHVPKSTVDKIFSLRTENPRRETLEAIEKVLFRGEDAARQDAFSQVLPAAQEGMAVRESTTAYGIHPEGEVSASAYGRKKNGEYTIEDYRKFPEDIRCELIDGHIYLMSSPNQTLQHVAAMLYMQLFRHILDNKDGCVPFIAPVDVILSQEDDKTVVQPDVFVVCDRNKLGDGGTVVGAPDFVIEVLSPATRKKDLTLKLSKYAQAGVREYWLVDAEKEQVLVYRIEDNCSMHFYGFQDQVPVGISLDGFAIDFARIREEMDYFSG